MAVVEPGADIRRETYRRWERGRLEQKRTTHPACARCGGSAEAERRSLRHRYVVSGGL